jgi:hypothetical protein
MRRALSGKSARGSSVGRRLDRLESAILTPPPDVVLRRNRRELRWQVLACKAVQEAAAEAGIDPDAIEALEIGRRAALGLRYFFDTPAKEAADEGARERDEAQWWAAELAEREGVLAEHDRAAGQYQLTGSRPAPDDALFEWLAWAWAQHLRADGGE